MECKTLANHPAYDSWSSSRYLHCSLFTPALCSQSMRCICFCRCFSFNQSRYTDSFDISLRIARFASYRKYRLSDSSLFNVSVSSACTNHPTPTHGDLCRNGKLQSRIQKSPYTSISLSDYRSHSGYCTSNCRSPPSSSTGKYRCFNHCSYPVPHLRVDREILCPFRSIGIHSYAITPRGAGLVTFGGFYRSRPIHNHRHGCLSKML